MSSKGQAGIRSGTAEEHLPPRMAMAADGNVLLDWSADAVYAVLGRFWRCLF